LIEHFYSAQIHSIECSWRLADKGSDCATCASTIMAAAVDAQPFEGTDSQWALPSIHTATKPHTQPSTNKTRPSNNQQSHSSSAPPPPSLEKSGKLKTGNRTFSKSGGDGRSRRRTAERSAGTSDNKWTASEIAAYFGSNIDKPTPSLGSASSVSIYPSSR
jgi:hypothetical protein